MSVSPIGSGQNSGAVSRVAPRPAGGFGDTLRAHIREQIKRELVGDPGAVSGGDSSAQQATRVPGIADTDNSAWAKLTRTIGQQYLSPSVADVFTRQIALESGNFAPDVIYGQRVSSAGAQGIAQLMPSSYPTVNRLDPVASLNAAAATMRDNLRLFGGDLRKALAAYNAGAGAVQNLVSTYGASWEAALPQETKLYLSRILG